MPNSASMARSVRPCPPCAAGSMSTASIPAPAEKPMDGPVEHIATPQVTVQAGRRGASSSNSPSTNRAHTRSTALASSVRVPDPPRGSRVGLQSDRSRRTRPTGRRGGSAAPAGRSTRHRSSRAGPSPKTRGRRRREWPRATGRSPRPPPGWPERSRPDPARCACRRPPGRRQPGPTRCATPAGGRAHQCNPAASQAKKRGGASARRLTKVRAVPSASAAVTSTSECTGRPEWTAAWIARARDGNLSEWISRNSSCCAGTRRTTTACRERSRKPSTVGDVIRQFRFGRTRQTRATRRRTSRTCCARNRSCSAHPRAHRQFDWANRCMRSHRSRGQLPSISPRASPSGRTSRGTPNRAPLHGGSRTRTSRRDRICPRTPAARFGGAPKYSTTNSASSSIDPKSWNRHPSGRSNRFTTVSNASAASSPNQARERISATTSSTSPRASKTNQRNLRRHRMRTRRRPQH